MEKSLKDGWTKGVNPAYCDISGAPAPSETISGGEKTKLDIKPKMVLG